MFLHARFLVASACDLLSLADNVGHFQKVLTGLSVPGSSHGFSKNIMSSISVLHPEERIVCFVNYPRLKFYRSRDYRGQSKGSYLITTRKSQASLVRDPVELSGKFILYHDKLIELDQGLNNPKGKKEKKPSSNRVSNTEPAKENWPALRCRVHTLTDWNIYSRR